MTILYFYRVCTTNANYHITELANQETPGESQRLDIVEESQIETIEEDHHYETISKNNATACSAGGEHSNANQAVNEHTLLERQFTFEDGTDLEEVPATEDIELHSSEDDPELLQILKSPPTIYSSQILGTVFSPIPDNPSNLNGNPYNFMTDGTSPNQDEMMCQHASHTTNMSTVHPMSEPDSVCTGSVMPQEGHVNPASTCQNTSLLEQNLQLATCEFPKTEDSTTNEDNVYDQPIFPTSITAGDHSTIFDDPNYLGKVTTDTQSPHAEALFDDPGYLTGLFGSKDKSNDACDATGTDGNDGQLMIQEADMMVDCEASESILHHEVDKVENTMLQASLSEDQFNNGTLTISAV